MMVAGRIVKSADGGWEAEFPAVDVYTQGESLDDVLAMIRDAFESLADGSFKVAVADRGTGEVVVEADDVAAFVPFVLRRLRQASGKSLVDAARAMGQSSPTAYARYENGDSLPAIDKLAELLAAVAPDIGLTLGPRK